ncbi:MAG: ATP-binding cassette domain-containing protein [Lentisphaerae bacterium]|nr:ATP-binding cassette domain-containing protein [Lentisphaerota bacterium]
MATDAVLRIAGLTKRFPGVIALEDVHLELKPGEVHALCGENGAGKSTLIKVISGVWAHGSYEGELTVLGQPARFRTLADAEAAGIAVIYQELALVPDMSVAENIFLGREPTRGGLIDWERVFAETRELLRRHGLGDLDPAARVGDLGVGQQQLVEIVKALAKQSRILLLDEPTAALTESEVAVLLDIVRGLRARGLTCVYISHKLDEVFAIADRITVLRDGRTMGTLETAKTSRRDLIRLMVGRDIDQQFPRRAGTVGAEILRVDDLTVTEAGRRRAVLEGITFSLHAGEVLGIGGLMGSGRTELLMHLFGAYGRRVRGTVTFAGAVLGGGAPDATIRRGLMLVSEDRKRYGLVLEQSIGFNLSLASLRQFTPSFLLDGHAEFVRNQELFQSLGVKAPGQESVVGQLSGGNQQKVVLGKALMTDPKVVMLDEPTRGIDVGAKLEVYNLVNRMTDEGRAVLMVSSELPELLGMSDRIIVLSEGRVGGTFVRGEATQEAILQAAMAHHAGVPAKE